MNAARTACSLALVSLLAQPGAAQQLETPRPSQRFPAEIVLASAQSDPEQIRAVLDSTAAGWNRGDLSRYLWAYDDSLTAFGATGFERGRAPLEAGMRAGFWKSGRPLEQLHYEQVDVRMLERDHALVTGKFVLSGADRPDRVGWFTTVWARTRVGWRMIHDHSS